MRGEAGSGFNLKFAFANVDVTSNNINVKPHHMFVSVHPSNGQYGAGATKADIGAGITVRARDGADNLLTGADNTNAGTDYVTVTVLETAGTVVDANLLGTKQLFLSGGEKNFADLGLQGDAGQHFKLRFSYNSLTVESSEFNVKPHHMFITVHPSDGQYGAGASKADIGAGISVRARDVSPVVEFRSHAISMFSIRVRTTC